MFDTYGPFCDLRYLTGSDLSHLPLQLVIDNRTMGSSEQTAKARHG